MLIMLIKVFMLVNVKAFLNVENINKTSLKTFLISSFKCAIKKNFFSNLKMVT